MVLAVLNTYVLQKLASAWIEHINMKTDHASNKIIHHIVHPNKKKKEYTPQSN